MGFLFSFDWRFLATTIILYEFLAQRVRLQHLILFILASILVLSPAYNCNNIHARIINQLTGILNKLKEFFICWILLPLSRGFEWVKWIMMLKWVPSNLHFIFTIRAGIDTFGNFLFLFLFRLNPAVLLQT